MPNEGAASTARVSTRRFITPLVLLWGVSLLIRVLFHHELRYTYGGVGTTVDSPERSRC